MKFIAHSQLLLAGLALLALAVFSFGPAASLLAQAAPAPAAKAPGAPAAPAAPAPDGAGSDDDDDFIADLEYNTYPSKGFDFLSAETIKQGALYGKCPFYGFVVNVSYPAQTGDERIDKLVRDKYSALFQEKRNELANGLKDGGFECPGEDSDEDYGERASELSLTFQAFAPSPGYLSVVYEEFQYAYGAAHPSTSYSTETYLIGQGKTMVLRDLFPSPEKSLPLFWAYASPLWCSFEKGSVPSFYTGDETDATSCQPGKAQALPARLKGQNLSLADLGNPVLTADGLTLNLDAYQGWSYADGPSAIDIPKAELIKMGANPKIWETPAAVGARAK